jgi:pimeloyl-ACP methyl ester carboxylesterase
LLQACGASSLSPDQAVLVEAARQAGATALRAKALDDGGLLLNGELEGRRFNLALPWRWNKQAMLFANGYRPPGFPIEIPEDPLAGDANGFYRTPYSQGFATGRTAYDKPGMGVQTGVDNTYRLKRFVDRLGARRTYLIGASMGGDITVALIEKYPQDFAGAIAACGAVGGWRAEIGWAVDLRAAYNYFTRGTAYELPGEHSITRSALWTPQQGLIKQISIPLVLVQTKRLFSPVLKLFAAAAANPNGPERRIIDNIAAVSGTQADPAGFVLPLSLTILGMDDLNQTFGGSIYDNSAKVYSSPLLSAAENAALNQGIERTQADPKAVAYADAWYQPSGNFQTPLMTLYNAIDPMAPSTLNEPLLLTAVERAGNLDRLVQRRVPAQRADLPTSSTEGYVHCGFTPDQVESAWNDLRTWVESGRKPAGS